MIQRFLKKRIGDVNWLYGLNILLFLNAVWFYLYGSVYYFDVCFCFDVSISNLLSGFD